MPSFFILIFPARRREQDDVDRPASPRSPRGNLSLPERPRIHRLSGRVQALEFCRRRRLSYPSPSRTASAVAPLPRRRRKRYSCRKDGGEKDVEQQRDDDDNEDNKPSASESIRARGHLPQPATLSAKSHSGKMTFASDRLIVRCPRTIQYQLNSISCPRHAAIRCNDRRACAYVDQS